MNNPNNPMMPFQDQMQIISNCPVCNSRNFPAQIRILAERENAHVLHIRCRKCHSNLLVLVTFGQQGVISTGLLTDLTSDEVLRFGQGRPVSSDDLIELYEQLTRSPKEIFEGASLDKPESML
jgi:hypothetical protein